MAKEVLNYPTSHLPMPGPAHSHSSQAKQKTDLKSGNEALNKLDSTKGSQSFTHQVIPSEM